MSIERLDFNSPEEWERLSDPEELNVARIKATILKKINSRRASKRAFSDA